MVEIQPPQTKNASDNTKAVGAGPAAITYGPNAPPPAVAPFDAAKAKQHQEAWAKHLGVPVEETNSIGMKLAIIPPGDFKMGSTPEEVQWALEYAQKNKIYDKLYLDRVSSEAPRHHVKISKPFYLAMYLVTQADYQKVVGTNPSAFTEKQVEAAAFKPPLDPKQVEEREKDVKKVLGKDTRRHPVETVSWEEAMEFCRKLSAMPAERAARRVYRLPTEAEWEYASRAGTATWWYYGDDEAGLAEVAWFCKNAGEMTHPVGEKKPNAWGLYDMSGNVYQWCSDWFSADYYKQSPPNDPCGPSAGSLRVLRGGYWYTRSSCCRSAYRYFPPAHRNHGDGFRVVCEIAPKAHPAAAIDPAFIKEVAALPAEEQVARVVAKLKELNPGYDGKETHKIENGQVTELILYATVKDISPVRPLAGLKHLELWGARIPNGNVQHSPVADLTPLQGLSLDYLSCANSDVRDLLPLRGMPLKRLNCSATKVADISPLQAMPLGYLDIRRTLVSDLSPLRDVPLTALFCSSTRVADLFPLKDTPLKDIHCDFDPKRDTEILRSIKTLERINGLPAAEFWKQVEAGKIPQPATGMKPTP